MVKKTTLFLSILFLFSCKKNTEIKDSNQSIQEIQTAALTDFSYKVALQSYRDMDSKINEFYTSCVALSSNRTNANLEQAKSDWKEVRSIWEKSEAFLFGPVSTENIDPGIDTWPVDYRSLDSLLATTNTFDQPFINSLGDELKGFHPCEYLLWGANSNKLPGDLTNKECEYLIALALDLRTKSEFLKNSWEPSTANNHLEHLINAGSITSVYTSKKVAFEEIVNAMIGICEEVANGKLFEPFAGQDSSIEESPFSGNSLIDFRNNIQGVKNVYYTSYDQSGVGIRDLVRLNNLSLNSSITSQLENALQSFDGITVPFSQAIFTQRTQIQNVITQINTLKATLENQLLPYIRQTIVE